mmetsp:Transcript_31914/g.74986  ORF Transcript_31914/g.74986 Transcript_31914/m.74986 type:complete len:93 (+) Transcript_31914:1252-1530(+)
MGGHHGIQCLQSDGRQRNDASGAELKRRCEVFSTRRGPADRARFKKLVQQLNAETAALKVAAIDANPEACDSTLRDIAVGEADLQRFVDSQK